MKRRPIKIPKRHIYILYHNGEQIARCNTMTDAFAESLCYKQGVFEIQQWEFEDGYILYYSQAARVVRFEITQNSINFPI